MFRGIEPGRIHKVERLVFGDTDLQIDLGMQGAHEELLYARSHVVLVSRVAGKLPPVDGVTTALDDSGKLQQDLDRARRLGFGGKLCVHPRQVETVNRGFRPSERELAWAKRVLEAAEASAGVAVRLDGELIDTPVITWARRILEQR